MKKIRNSCLFILAAYCSQLVAVSCNSIDLYEKSVPLPQHKWKNSFKPSFTFTIKDTTAAYQIFFVLRHNDQYNYNNIYINLYATLPGQDTALKIRRDLTLATNDKGWLGQGMDDIYEHRIKLGEPQSLKAGTYTFTLEQIMREDPLENVLDAGLRIQKK